MGDEGAEVRLVLVGDAQLVRSDRSLARRVAVGVRCLRPLPRDNRVILRNLDASADNRRPREDNHRRAPLAPLAALAADADLHSVRPRRLQAAELLLSLIGRDGELLADASLRVPKEHLLARDHQVLYKHVAGKGRPLVAAPREANVMLTHLKGVDGDAEGGRRVEADLAGPKAPPAGRRRRAEDRSVRAARQQIAEPKRGVVALNRRDDAHL